MYRRERKKPQREKEEKVNWWDLTADTKPDLLATTLSSKGVVERRRFLTYCVENFLDYNASLHCPKFVDCATEILRRSFTDTKHSDILNLACKASTLTCLRLMGEEKEKVVFENIKEQIITVIKSGFSNHINHMAISSLVVLYSIVQETTTNEIELFIEGFLQPNLETLADMVYLEEEKMADDEDTLTHVDLEELYIKAWTVLVSFVDKKKLPKFLVWGHSTFQLLANHPSPAIKLASLEALASVLDLMQRIKNNTRNTFILQYDKRKSEIAKLFHQIFHDDIIWKDNQSLKTLELLTNFIKKDDFTMETPFIKNRTEKSTGAKTRDRKFTFITGWNDACVVEFLHGYLKHSFSELFQIVWKTASHGRTLDFTQTVVNIICRHPSSKEVTPHIHNFINYGELSYPTDEESYEPRSTAKQNRMRAKADIGTCKLGPAILYVS